MFCLVAQGLPPNVDKKDLETHLRCSLLSLTKVPPVVQIALSQQWRLDFDSKEEVRRLLERLLISLIYSMKGLPCSKAIQSRAV